MSGLENAHTAKEVLPVVRGVKKLISSKQYTILNNILLNINIDNISSTAKVSFISSAFPVRNKLKNWDIVINDIKNSLYRQGLDADYILKGLY